MLVTLEPGTAVRVTPRDQAALLLGAAAAGAAVGFRPALSAPSSAEADEAGVVAMPATQPPDLVEVTWDEGGVECSATVEVVARHYCSLADVLAHGSAGDTPADHGAGEAEAWAARARAVETVERNAARRFVETVARQRVAADRSVRPLEWPDASAVACSDPTADAWTVGDAAVVCSACGSPEVEVTYRCGLAAVPDAIRAATAALAASYLTPSRVPDRATGESTDAGMLHFTLAGIDGATGIPDVDAAITQFGRRRPEVL